jgi:hypothetical protein
VLKPGETPFSVLLDGYVPVPSVLASQVSHVILTHSNNWVQPLDFQLTPKSHTFKANIMKPKVQQVKHNDQESIKMKCNQLPFIINNATTGHKLQGASVDNLFVHNWSYVTNWAYVMLSHVRTLAGLYCRKPLSRDLKKHFIECCKTSRIVLQLTGVTMNMTICL